MAAKSFAVSDEISILIFYLLVRAAMIVFIACISLMNLMTMAHTNNAAIRASQPHQGM